MIKNLREKLATRQDEKQDMELKKEFTQMYKSWSDNERALLKFGLELQRLRPSVAEKLMLEMECEGEEGQFELVSVTV